MTWHDIFVSHMKIDHAYRVHVPRHKNTAPDSLKFSKYTESKFQPTVWAEYHDIDSRLNQVLKLTCLIIAVVGRHSRTDDEFLVDRQL